MIDPAVTLMRVSAVLAELGRRPTERDVAAVLVAFGVSRQRRRQWWREPSPWLEGVRPVDLMNRAGVEPVFCAAVAALLQTVGQLSDLGGPQHVAVAVETVIRRLASADAPLSLIRQVRRLAPCLASSGG